MQVLQQEGGKQLKIKPYTQQLLVKKPPKLKSKS